MTQILLLQLALFLVQEWMCSVGAHVIENIRQESLILGNTIDIALVMPLELYYLFKRYGVLD